MQAIYNSQQIREKFNYLSVYLERLTDYQIIEVQKHIMRLYPKQNPIYYMENALVEESYIHYYNQ